MSTPEELLGFAPGEEFTEKVAVPDRHAKIRGERFDVEQWADRKKLITFMNVTRHVPLDAVDDYIVNESYSAVVWLFREAVANGDLKGATTAEKWLAWAKPIINRPKKVQEPKPSKGSVAFLAREPSGETPGGGD